MNRPQEDFPVWFIGLTLTVAYLYIMTIHWQWVGILVLTSCVLRIVHVESVLILLKFHSKISNQKNHLIVDVLLTHLSSF